jgi:hypothetical protein
MKRTIMLSIALNSLLLAGCCTHRATNWEYKTVFGGPGTGGADPVINAEAAQGWSVIGFSASDSGNKWFLLRRPKQ